MTFFGATHENHTFYAYSTAHWFAIGALLVMIVLLWLIRGYLKRSSHLKKIEIAFALSLASMEILYNLWLVHIKDWKLAHSLPLELCSISLWLTVILLFTRSKLIYDIVFFIGIGGALQAILTPELYYSFPHFRYFHFFYTHIIIITSSLYFTWVRGYRPTFRALAKTMLFLNILLPFIMYINHLFKGNYMFLSRKPGHGSLLDLLGPYPWYILSLEGVAFFIFALLWILFRQCSTAKIVRPEQA
ncbi:TIGR02206 family membrane protein [Priestia koreensis]|uniref:YwaF family protein n=1 Tax=Priestia koreensis TaxID=284581 RepID=UPI003CFE4C93